MEGLEDLLCSLFRYAFWKCGCKLGQVIYYSLVGFLAFITC